MPDLQEIVADEMLRRKKQGQARRKRPEHVFTLRVPKDLQPLVSDRAHDKRTSINYYLMDLVFDDLAKDAPSPDTPDQDAVESGLDVEVLMGVVAVQTATNRITFNDTKQVREFATMLTDAANFADDWASGQPLQPGTA